MTTKVYKMRRLSDGLYFGSRRTGGDKHDRAGKFYSCEDMAIQAIEMSGNKLENYQAVIFTLEEVDVINYKEVMAE